MKSSLSALLPSIAGGLLVGDTAGATVFCGVSTDSRNVAPGNLFVALRGEHFDAHVFLDAVVAQGAAAVVVERALEELPIPMLVVPDTRMALGQIARYWRRHFSLPLIGVTGSNGKTTVKEMISAILAAAYGPDHALATRGNLNNEIGVPLTLFRLDKMHRAAVVELGMNHPGEIALLAAIAQPTLGLVNNAQREHQEFMTSVAAVAEENGAVLAALPADGVAVFPADDPFTPLWHTMAQTGGQRRVVTFGLTADADVTCSFEAVEDGSNLLIRHGAQSFPVHLQAMGLHNVRNALAAAACTLGIGIDADAVRRGLESFVPVSGRLQRKLAAGGARVIDDTYNANPDSVRAAIDVLAQAAAPRMLVLGDMGEVGSDGRTFHEEIGAHAASCGIEHLFTMGQLAHHAAAAFGAAALHCNDIDMLKQAVESRLTSATTVLVKGSRFMKMERVVGHLINQPTKEVH